MSQLPPGTPTELFEAFGHIATLKSPSVDDLKVMVYLEAAGKRLYDDMAAGAPNAEVAALLQRSGREELAHAYRVSEAIGKLTGTPFPVPATEDNPFLDSPPPVGPVNKAALLSLAEAEFGGKALYETWAQNCSNPEAAALFRLNGGEEAGHGVRLQKAAELLDA